MPDHAELDCLLCIDAGQTGVRGEIIASPTTAEPGELIAEIDAPGIESERPALDQLVAFVGQAVDVLPAGAQLRQVAAGVSGLGADANAQRWLSALPSQVQRVVVAHDSITGYLAALGDQPGAVLACGTGVVTLAVGPAGTARVDGWGHLIGDAGSGFWIGRAGLDLVMRAYDGRAEPTTLTGPVQADFPDLPQMYLTLQRDPARVSRIASYAQTVSEHAQAGDAGCVQILQDAGRELAASAIAGLRRVGLSGGEQVPIGLVGMVFDSKLLRDAFETAISHSYPRAEFVRAAKRGLTGARALANLPEHSELSGAVLAARR